MKMNDLSVKHLISINDLETNDLNTIFKTAESFKEIINRPIKKVPTLRDITIANLFFENSTRTKLSFELAEKRLSADVINFSASSSSVKKGESLSQIAKRYIPLSETAVEDLVSFNKLRSSNLEIGQLIKIPIEKESKSKKVY